ncbi:MAG: peptidylprolyl isomerase [Xanthomonadales bacterium]|nr:peptidylprolyl isomerase [Xanthomonadales bacterium]
MNKTTPLGLALLLAGFLMGFKGNAGAESLDRIVAVVEDEIILRSELDRSMANVIKQFQAAGQPLPSRNVLERQILESLAMIKLKLQNARATGIIISDPEVDQAIQRVAAQSGITVDQMRRTILADGLSWERFREDMRDELTTQQLQRRVANTKVNITEGEIDLFLENQELPQGDYRLSHILVSVPEGASPDEIQAARQKVEDVHQQLQEGLDFATAAITYSNGPQALQGGDLGWRPASQVPTLMEQELATMEKGQYSRPMRDASGFHIFKVADYRAVSQTLVEEINARHIMIMVTELVNQEEALELVTTIHERIEGGEAFEDLARQFSDDNTSANLGGDMGWFQPGTFGQRVQQVLDQLDDDELSQPFQTNAGWHILQKLGVREQDRTVEIQRETARNAIRRRKAEDELRLWERELKDEAYIEYRI